MANEKVKREARGAPNKTKYTSSAGIKIRNMRRRGVSYAQIAREMGIDHNTAKQWDEWYQIDHDNIDIRAKLEETIAVASQRGLEDDRGNSWQWVSQLISAAQALGIPEAKGGMNEDLAKLLAKAQAKRKEEHSAEE